MNEDAASAIVLGSRRYHVSLARVGSDWRCDCTCPAFAKFGPCKHVWALVLATDSRARAAAPIGPDGESSAGIEEFEERDWRWQLEDLRLASETDRTDPWEGLAAPPLEFAYLIELDDEHRVADGLRVTVLRRRRQKDGRQGRWRVFRFDTRDDPVPPDLSDRRLLDALLASRSESTSWRTGWSSDPRKGRIFVESTISDLLLPQIVRTGRAFAASAATIASIARHGSLAGAALKLDEGEHWTLSVRTEQDERRCRLVGTLERSGETLELSRVQNVLTATHFLSEGRVHPFLDSGGWLERLRDQGSIEAPRSEEREFLDALEQLPLPLAVETSRPHGAGAPVPHLWIEKPDRIRRNRPLLGCRISFDYPEGRVRMSDPKSVVRSEADAITRDPGAERAALRDFLEHGVRFDDQNDYPDCDAAIRARDVPDVVTALLDAGWNVEAEGVRYRRPGPLRLSIRSGIDWFDLDGGVEFEGEEIPLPALLEAARRGLRTIVLGDGTFGVLPQDWLGDWNLLETIGESHGEKFRFRQNQAWMLDALLSARGDVDVDARFASWRQSIAKFEGIAPAREPRTFRGTLRTYQREGLAWMRFLREVGFGGCLADDMGLGKTVQVLSLLDGNLRTREDGKTRRPSLVVAPRSVIHNWENEAEKFTPRLRVLLYSDRDRKRLLPEFANHDLVVTTYGVLRRDILELRELQFDTVILDEAQAIKNERSRAAKSARLLDAEHRLALSGTPIENDLGELWSLLEFLNPGMLGRVKSFKDVMRHQEFGPSERSELAGAIRPFLLRRTKEQVLSELPEKTEQTIYCELDARQRRDYAEIRDHYRATLLAKAGTGLQRMKLQVLEALLRLRQVACHPGLVDSSRTGESSAKIDALLPLLDEVRESGHKALVFSQFTSLLAIVRRRLDEAGLVYEYLDGRTRDRQRRVDRFQSDAACPFFLISLKAGGLGLNLTAADYVFLLDPWWNPAVEAQAIDRAHRIGQTRNVTAYRLICQDTVEEKVLELQQQKRDLADAILGDGKTVLRDLTRDDLEALLS